jgi:hypothetical protein
MKEMTTWAESALPIRSVRRFEFYRSMESARSLLSTLLPCEPGGGYDKGSR